MFQIPGDRTVGHEVAEQIFKCKKITVEIQRMWTVKLWRYQ
jgi:hypothetical protein